MSNATMNLLKELEQRETEYFSSVPKESVGNKELPTYNLWSSSATLERSQHLQDLDAYWKDAISRAEEVASRKRSSTAPKMKRMRPTYMGASKLVTETQLSDLDKEEVSNLWSCVLYSILTF